MTTDTAGRPRPHRPSSSPHDAPCCALTLLGGCGVTCGGRTLPLPPAPLRLVALLALSRAPLDRRDLAVELWPDAAPGPVARRMRNTLWQARSACPELIEVDGPFVTLGRRVEVDVAKMLALARRLADRDDDDPALADVDPDRLSAELLPRWTEDWAVTEREHLRTRALVALEALAGRQLDAGRPLDAIDVAYLAARADPLRETTAQVLMRAHLALGNRVDALRTYETFSRRLREELGADIRPLPETNRILSDVFLTPDDAGEDSLPPPSRATAS